MLSDRRTARAAAADQRDLIEPSSIIIDAKSGTTGARRAASNRADFSRGQRKFRAYKVGNHRHVPEMEQEISAALGRDIRCCSFRICCRSRAAC